MADQPPAAAVYTYARVSVTDEKTGSCSLAWQADTIRDWLDAHAITNQQDYVDNGVSASVPLDQRRAGGQLVREAQKRGDVIVVARLDRLFRDVQDFRTRLTAWLAQGVQLVSCSEQLDFTTATGRLIATILAAVSEYERELIGQRVRDAIETRKEAGLRASTEARYGWRFVGTGRFRTDGQEELRIEPHPTEQWTIGRIVALRDQGKSLRAIADELTKGKHKTRRGGDWSHSTVADILREIELHRAAPSDYLRRFRNDEPEFENLAENNGEY